MSKKSKFRGAKMVKMAILGTFNVTKINFTLNLSGSKILKFPHSEFLISLPRSVDFHSDCVTPYLVKIWYFYYTYLTYYYIHVHVLFAFLTLHYTWFLTCNWVCWWKLHLSLNKYRENILPFLVFLWREGNLITQWAGSVFNPQKIILNF